MIHADSVEAAGGEIDPFELLGLSPVASTCQEATEAFRELLLVVHPDKGGSARDLRVLTEAHQYVQYRIRTRGDAGSGSSSSPAAPPPVPPTFAAFRKRFERAVYAAGDDGGASGTAAAEAAAEEVSEFNRRFESMASLPIYNGPGGDLPEFGAAGGSIMTPGPPHHQREQEQEQEEDATAPFAEIPGWACPLGAALASPLDRDPPAALEATLEQLAEARAAQRDLQDLGFRSPNAPTAGYRLTPADPGEERDPTHA